MENLSESGNIPEENEWYIRYKMGDAKISLHFFHKNVRKASIPYFISSKFAITATYSSLLTGDINKDFITLERTYYVGEVFDSLWCCQGQ